MFVFVFVPISLKVYIFLDASQNQSGTNILPHGKAEYNSSGENDISPPLQDESPPLSPPTTHPIPNPFSEVRSEASSSSFVQPDLSPSNDFEPVVDIFGDASAAIGQRSSSSKENLIPQRNFLDISSPSSVRASKVKGTLVLMH